MEPLLRVESVTKDFRAGEATLHILKGVSLDVRAGEILSIVGPSGAGKSTLLHIMGFIDRPTLGDLFFRGRPLLGLSSAEQANLRNRSFGFIFQMHHLLPELTAVENVIIPMMIRTSCLGWLASGRSIRRKAAQLLERIGMGHRLKHRPGQLSGGEQQRVALARALIGDPEIVFCDEPTGNLDSATNREIRQLILDLNRETGRTFVIVTHDQEVAALAHRSLRIVDGLLA